MAKGFDVGDHVSWNSEAGRVRGTIRVRVEWPIVKMVLPGWRLIYGGS
jgi:hypothetical protein